MSLIEELQEKATYTNYATDGQKVIYLSKQQFAESIVRECAFIAAQSSNNVTAAFDILEHFNIAPEVQ